MRTLKRALGALFILLLVVVVVLFVLENQAAVTLSLFGWAAPAVPAAVLMLAALIVGLAVGPLLGVFAVQRSKRRIRASAREAALAKS